MNAPNNSNNGDITITFSGQFTINRSTLEGLIRPSEATPSPVPSVPTTNGLPKFDEDGKLPRLAYTMRETAEILGISYITVHRLLQRGLMRSSLALRTKLIPKKEIEKFLATTMSER